MKTKIMLTAFLLSISAQATAQTYVFRAVSGAPAGESSLVDRDSGGEVETPTEPPESEYGGGWVAFAQEFSLPYTLSFDSLNWGNRSLQLLPTVAYPNSHAMGSIDVSNNALNSTHGLRTIEYIHGNLNLSNNSIIELNLPNLMQVNGSLNLSNNPIENWNIQNLDYIEETLDISNTNISNFNSIVLIEMVGILDARNNNLTSLSGLENLYINDAIYLDADYSGERLHFTTPFCSSAGVLFSINGPGIMQLCYF
jgi:hypothetical protein